MFKLFHRIIFYCIFITFSAYSSHKYSESDQNFDHVHIVRRHYIDLISTLEKIKEPLHYNLIHSDKIMGFKSNNWIMITQFGQNSDGIFKENNQDFSLNNIQMTYGIPLKLNKDDFYRSTLKISCMAIVAVINALQEEKIEALVEWKNKIIIDQQKAGDVFVDFTTKNLILISVKLNNVTGPRKFNSFMGDSDFELYQYIFKENLITRISENLYSFFKFPDFWQDNIDKPFARYNELLAYKDKEIEVIDDSGQIINGIHRGIDFRGRLLLDTGLGIKTFTDGKITLCP